MVAIAWTRGRSLRRSVRVGAARGARSKSFRDLPQEGAHAIANLTSRGAPTSRMGMTTVWRPRVRIAVPRCRRCREHGYIERGVDQEGHEAEESPSHKGAVRARGEDRSNVQGVQSLVRTVVGAVSARSAVGHAICEHGRVRSQCKECGGASICEHGRQRHRCKECGGSSICEHGRQRSQCKECGGSIWSTVVRSLQGVRWCRNLRARSYTQQCKECGGASICEHGRRRSKCKECGGSSICEHGRQRYNCKECGGAGICEHGRRRHRCKECS